MDTDSTDRNDRHIICSGVIFPPPPTAVGAWPSALRAYAPV